MEMEFQGSKREHGDKATWGGGGGGCPTSVLVSNFQASRSWERFPVNAEGRSSTLGQRYNYSTLTHFPLSVETQCGQDLRGNSNRCVHLEVPPGTRTQPLWHPRPSSPPPPHIPNTAPLGIHILEARLHNTKRPFYCEVGEG